MYFHLRNDIQDPLNDFQTLSNHMPMPLKTKVSQAITSVVGISHAHPTTKCYYPSSSPLNNCYTISAIHSAMSDYISNAALVQKVLQGWHLWLTNTWIATSWDGIGTCNFDLGLMSVQPQTSIVMCRDLQIGPMRVLCSTYCDMVWLNHSQQRHTNSTVLSSKVC